MSAALEVMKLIFAVVSFDSGHYTVVTLPYLGACSYPALRPQQFIPMHIPVRTEGHENLFEALANLIRALDLALLSISASI